IGDVMNKKIADDRLSQWREHSHTKIQVMGDFDEHTGGSFFEGPDNKHAFSESLQMIKAHFEFFPIDNLLGHPGNRNTGTGRSHDDNIAVDPALEIFDIAVVRQDFWPELKVCRGFKDLGARRVHND